MLHLDACTRCGRCHEVCPARTTNYPLSPRDLIVDLRLHNDECQGKSLEDKAIVNDVISSDTLWACRSCGACQEVCPVGIEHPSLIVRMRRQLVDRGDMDPMLQTTLNTIANTGNSFGEPARTRGAWTSSLEFKVKDIRQESAKNLWFVGDYASFDPRNQKVSQTVARLLHEASLDFALLHEGERTAGNDVRRVGEEGLWELLAENNLEQMNESKDFEQIITTDPHSYNTIKNEYPDLGKVAKINHYTSVLVELLKTQKLQVRKPLNLKVTFHDPCHLGRLNGGYDAPRELLKLIGCELLEMPRSRENSFCCGAGGGRIWIPDKPGAEKPSENRIREAVALEHAQIFVTCCPKDLTMFEDARKTANVENKIEVRDIAELVAEAVGSGVIKKDDFPVIAEQLTEAIATRIADVVTDRLEKILTGQNLVTKTDISTGDASADEATQVKTGSGAVLEEAQQKALAEDPIKVQQVEVEQTSADESRREQVSLTPVDWNKLNPVTAAEFSPYEIPEPTGPRILVMVKHATVLGDDYEFTADGCDVKSEYFEHVLNEWDDVALEEALLAMEKMDGAEVVAVTVGPPDADITLRKVLAKGANRAVRVWDESLVGADPISIARALAGIAKLEKPDLILCGVQTSDFAHGSTGMALARILELPHASVVVDIDWDGKGMAIIQRELEGGTLHNFTVETPAVFAVQTGINQPRYATMRMIKQAKKKSLEVVDGSDVLDGSGGYQVRRMYVPEQTKAEMLSGDAKEIAERIAEIIHEHKGGKS
ncbi:MAG: 4Fe-4S dicluster domain-containing protein [Opitutae bacterium]|nr:4Fe-4S dicluster domain-containing protein [Opitutae bacterium]